MLSIKELFPFLLSPPRESIRRDAGRETFDGSSPRTEIIIVKRMGIESFFPFHLKSERFTFHSPFLKSKEARVDLRRESGL